MQLTLKWTSYNWLFHQGTKQFDIKQILKLLKTDLKNLNTGRLQHISARAATARQNLEEVQDAGLTQGTMPNNYKEVQQSVARINAAEHSFYVQRAKLGYFK